MLSDLLVGRLQPPRARDRRPALPIRARVVASSFFDPGGEPALSVHKTVQISRVQDEYVPVILLDHQPSDGPHAAKHGVAAIVGTHARRIDPGD